MQDCKNDAIYDLSRDAQRSAPVGCAIPNFDVIVKTEGRWNGDPTDDPPGAPWCPESFVSEQERSQGWNGDLVKHLGMFFGRRVCGQWEITSHLARQLAKYDRLRLAKMKAYCDWKGAKEAGVGTETRTPASPDVPRDRCLSVAPSDGEPLVLWMNLVGHSGMGKTTAVKAVRCALGVSAESSSFVSLEGDRDVPHLLACGAFLRAGEVSGTWTAKGVHHRRPAPPPDGDVGGGRSGLGSRPARTKGAVGGGPRTSNKRARGDGGGAGISLPATPEGERPPPAKRRRTEDGNLDRLYRGPRYVVVHVKAGREATPKILDALRGLQLKGCFEVDGQAYVATRCTVYVILFTVDLGLRSSSVRGLRPAAERNGEVAGRRGGERHACATTANCWPVVGVGCDCREVEGTGEDENTPPLSRPPDRRGGEEPDRSDGSIGGHDGRTLDCLQMGHVLIFDRLPPSRLKRMLEETIWGHVFSIETSARQLKEGEAHLTFHPLETLLVDVYSDPKYGCYMKRGCFDLLVTAALKSYVEVESRDPQSLQKVVLTQVLDSAMALKESAREMLFGPLGGFRGVKDVGTRLVYSVVSKACALSGSRCTYKTGMLTQAKEDFDLAQARAAETARETMGRCLEEAHPGITARLPGRWSGEVVPPKPSSRVDVGRGGSPSLVNLFGLLTERDPEYYLSCTLYVRTRGFGGTYDVTSYEVGARPLIL
jgi:hypothetical protein